MAPDLKFSVQGGKQTVNGVKDLKGVLAGLDANRLGFTFSVFMRASCVALGESFEYMSLCFFIWKLKSTQQSWYMEERERIGIVSRTEKMCHICY